jgi:anti-sigma regulatory factor (Ser/Thr protein kinase)
MTSTESRRFLHRRKEFPARMAAFGEIKSFLEGFGADASLHPDDWLKLVLLAEELFTNTIRHGYSGESDERVVVEIELQDLNVRLTYTDSAPQYDPLSAAERVNLQSSPEDRPVGGLGMLLTVRLTESASYSFSGGRNRVELTLVRSR